MMVLMEEMLQLMFHHTLKTVLTTTMEIRGYECMNISRILYLHINSLSLTHQEMLCQTLEG